MAAVPVSEKDLALAGNPWVSRTAILSTIMVPGSSEHCESGEAKYNIPSIAVLPRDNAQVWAS